jgi:hypothetical protein
MSEFNKMDEVRRKISRLINERGLNYAQVSLQIGKNIAYIQQFIKNGSPRRLGEVERRKLAQILKVDEQELTDLPISSKNATSPAALNSEVLAMIIEYIETWLDNRKSTLSPHDKAELIKLIYLKTCTEAPDAAAHKIKDFIEIYDELRKAN